MAECAVIGGNGFLGSHLVDELLARGHAVRVFDRFSTEPTWQRQGATIERGDFLNRNDLQRVVDGAEFVFHFLSTSTPATAEADPTLDIRTNLAQTVELLALCADAGVGRVYFASSGGAMYGDIAGTAPLAETMVPQPVSPYAIGKLAIEGYLRYFERTRGLQSTIFRISNPYGPRQHAMKGQGVIPIFLQLLAEGRQLPVYGDGTAVRDYVYVTDASRMIAETVGATPEHAIYNIGSGVGTSLAEVVTEVQTATGMTAAIDRRSHPATFLNHVVLDISRYEAEFGTQELIGLPEGVARTWQSMAAAE